MDVILMPKITKYSKEKQSPIKWTAHVPKICIKPASVAMFLQFIIALSYVLYITLKIIECDV